jgi:serine/threonine protein kinase
VVNHIDYREVYISLDLPSDWFLWKGGHIFVMAEREHQIKQTRDEERIISNLKVCKMPDTPTLNDLDAQVLKARLNEDFYSYSLLEALQCYFDVTLHGSEQGIPTAPDDIHRYLTGGKKIGGDSAEGVAILAGIDNVRDLVIIKAPKDPRNDGLVHEYFVSVTCLNKLRRYVPGFMYSFGAFRCSAPLIQHKKLLEWCEPDGPSVNYVLFEKVVGPSLSSLMPVLNLEEYLSYIIQIAFNLQRAVHDNSFTHYDLHDQNILCREVAINKKNKEFYVPFILPGGETVYVRSNRVATIIDYGRVHIKYNNKHYGFYSKSLRTIDGLYPDKCRPLYDIYKVIGFSLYSLLESGKNKELFKGLMDLVSFFRPIKNYPSYLATIKREKDSFYVLSVDISLAEKNSSIQDFLAFVEEKYSVLWNRIIRSRLKDDDWVVTCGGLIKAKNEEDCKDLKYQVSRLQLRIVKNKNIARDRSNAKELISEVKNTENRLLDIRRAQKELDSSVEYVSTREANERAKRLLNENYTSLRQELKDRISFLKQSIIQESAVYQGLKEFDTRVSKDSKENDKHLREIYEMLVRSHFLLLIKLSKSYIADRATLLRLEEMKKENNPTDQRSFLLPRRAIEPLIVDIDKVSRYLVKLKPLSGRGEALRVALYNEIDLS